MCFTHTQSDESDVDTVGVRTQSILSKLVVVVQFIRGKNIVFNPHFVSQG